jgi:hypothetical protein
MKEFLEQAVKFNPANSPDVKLTAMVMAIEEDGIADLTVWAPGAEAEQIKAVPKKAEGDNGSFSTWEPE